MDHSPDAGTGLLSPISYAATRNFITSGKSHVQVLAWVLGARRSNDAWF